MRSVLKATLSAIMLALSYISASAGVPCSVPYTLTNGTTANATQVMANYQALITCLGNAAAAGSNSDITALLALSTPLTPSQGGSTVYYASTTATLSSNAITITATIPSNVSLTQGVTVVALISGTNTGATTLTVGSLATKNVYKLAYNGPSVLTGNEIQSNQIAIFTYDGTQWELMNPAQEQGGSSGQCTIASASTMDLNTCGSHFVVVTGSTTITNLGNSLAGNTANPRWFVRFLSNLTITANSSNCATTGGCIYTPGGTNISVQGSTQGGDSMTLVYLGQGSNGGTGAGDWLVEQYSHTATGIGRLVAGSPQVFTSSGTYTPTAGMIYADVECMGPGGGGGGAASTSSAQAAAGSGGASGAYTRGIFTASTIGSSQTVTIGTGGASGSAGSGSTTFGALLTAGAGGAGTASGASTGFAFGAGPTGPTTVSGGYINLNGNAGNGWQVGGSSATAAGGTGGPGLYGMGSGVAGSADGANGAAGGNGTAPGAGGGGAGNGTSQSARNGGTGANGICIVHEYLS
jgi:hypothetical protein